MKHSDFVIGKEFTSSSGRRWLCTDIGTRTIIAIPISAKTVKDGWDRGPPYALNEIVFDEEDIETCEVEGSEDDD